MGLSHRITRVVKRLLLPVCVLLYLLLSVFNLHTRNIYNNQVAQLEPYTGGVIDDIRRIKCHVWNGPCNQIIEETVDEDNVRREVIWHRVPKSIDLNGESPKKWALHHEYLYVHYAATNEFDSGRSIIDIAIGDPKSVDPPPYVVKDSQTSTGRPRSRIDTTYNYNSWDLKQDGIWAKYDRISAEDSVTDLMYLFGEDVIEPRLDWTLVSGQLSYRSKHPVRLSIRRGAGKEITILSLKENSKGEFKVLQLSDLHFSSDFGVCKDQAIKDPDCKADAKTLNFIHQVLDLEKPELVVFTGDLLDGFHTFDYQTAILKALSPLIARSIPYAIAFGENDKNQYADRSEIINFILSLPYSVMKSDADQIQEVTNYALPIYDSSKGELQSMIYVLDLYYETNIKNQATRFLKEYYDRLPTKPKLSLAFQYYPIKEFRPRGTFAIVGQYNERQKLKAKTDPDTRKVLSDIDVQAISVGYEHTNECCVQNDGSKDGLKSLWMCFGSSVGEGAHGSTKLDRRVRLFRLNSQTKEITSWKRSQSQPASVFDYQFIHQTS